MALCHLKPLLSVPSAQQSGKKQDLENSEIGSLKKKVLSFNDLRSGFILERNPFILDLLSRDPSAKET